MIQENEIRAGNIFNLKRGKGWTWTEITPTIIGKIFSSDTEYALNDFEPIPLRPEILELLGFKEVRPTQMPGYSFHRSPSFDNHKRFRWDSVDGLAIETVGSGWIWRFRELKYVHQYQNLFFALTGTELSINLEQVKV